MIEVAQTINVNTDPACKSGFKTLNICDIRYMIANTSKKHMVIHAVDGSTYYTIGSVSYWSSIMTSSKYDFIRADRSIIANVARIVYMDKAYNKAFFDVGKQIGCFLSEKAYANAKSIIACQGYNVEFQELPLW